MLKNNISIDKDYIIEALFQGNHIAVLVVDKKRNNIMANHKFCEMFGYTLEEILETDVEMFHISHENFVNFGQIAFDHVIQNIPMSLNYEFKRKDGSRFWAKISGDPLKNKEFALWTLVDITENIEIKKELENQKELLKTVINETPYPIVLKDYDAKFVLVNKATATLYGCSNPDEMIGKDDGDYIPDKDMAEFFRKNVREIMDKNETQVVYEDSIDVETNEVRNYMSIKKPFINKNGEKMILVLANDITEINKKNDEIAKKEKILFQQSKLASMGEMLSNIAHQWRQPLSAISTLSTSMKLEDELGILDKDSMYNSLDNINETTKYLSQTIEDFRGYFDPRTNNLNSFQIESLIKKVTKLLRAQYKSKDIKIIEEIEDYELISNENELMQVLINILNNARDALEPVLENRFIIIKTKKEEDKHIIEIIDNAGGIEKEIIDKVFDPYFTTKHKSQGTGIGLYMSEQIITKHLDGTLSIENKTFTYDNKEYIGANFKIVL